MPRRYNLYKSLAEKYKGRKIYFENYLDYVKEIKKKSESFLGGVRVLVFGSIVRENHSVSSDIDILVISQNIPGSIFEQAKIKYELVKDYPDNPFQIHLATPSQYEDWYKKFIKEYIEIKI